MMNKKLLIACLTLTGFSFAQTDILDARTNFVGQTVTISGVVTNGGELGGIRYLQDGTAGLSAYGSPATNADIGDTVTFTGTLTDYQGLLELSPTTNAIIHGTAVVQPEPLNIPVALAGENYESQLITFENVTIDPAGDINFTVVNTGTNYEITDGSDVVDIRIGDDATSIDGQPIPAGAVNITGLLSEYNGSYQLLPRTIADIVPYVAPDKEINVSIGGATYLSGSTYIVGSDVATTVTIENTGSGSALTITGVSYSGVSSADFGSTGVPASVPASGSETFTIDFTAMGTGSRLATIEIVNNDADEANYTINLYAVGTDGLATEPSAIPTSLVFPEFTAYNVAGSFTPEASADNYLVLWNEDVAPDTAPIDGMNYMRGDIIGNSTVVQVGSGSGFSPRHSLANSNYHFAVYAYNGPAGFENYTANSLDGDVTTTGLEIGSYYNGIDPQAGSFVTSLSSLINPHIVLSYGNYKAFVMNQFEVRDTTMGRSAVTCSYSGEVKIFNGTFDWSDNNFSREHSYPHSWMPSYNDTDVPEYSDYHNLYPVNQDDVNAVRNNHPLGEVTGAVSSTHLLGTLGLDSRGILVYEPRDEHKGNAARAMMYMAICYNGIGAQNWRFDVDQEQEVLKQWHFADLPDAYEIARQEKIYALQDNRNPFIDSVNFANFVDFSNMAYLSIEENEFDVNVDVYPNPVNNTLNVSLEEHLSGVSIQIKDIQGRVITEMNKSQLYYQFNTSDWASGVYFVEINSEKSSLTKKVVKQ